MLNIFLKLSSKSARGYLGLFEQATGMSRRLDRGFRRPDLEKALAAYTKETGFSPTKLRRMAIERINLDNYKNAIAEANARGFKHPYQDRLMKWIRSFEKKDWGKPSRKAKMGKHMSIRYDSPSPPPPKYDMVTGKRLK